MPTWMFDTVALIDYYHGRPGVLSYLESILDGRANGTFSTVTELELWQGIGLAPILLRLASQEAGRSLVLVRDSLLGELQERLGSVEQVPFEVSEGNRGELPRLILERLT